MEEGANPTFSGNYGLAPPMSKHLPRVRILCYLALLCGLAYLPSLIGLCEGAWPFADDALAATRIWREFTRQALQAGRLPLWNPHLFCGIAFISTGQSGVFYAPNFIYWLLPVRVALWCDAVGHNLLLLAGMYVLARALRLSHMAALLAAIAFGLGGAVAGHVYAGHANWHAARAYLPWELWALLTYLRSGHKRYAYCLAVLFACQVAAGYPPMVILSAGLCCGLGLAWIVSHWIEQRVIAPSAPLLPRGWLRATGLVVVLTGTLAAVCVLPLREMSKLSVHGAGLSYADAVTQSASWRSFVRLLAPNFFGGNQPLEWSALSNPHEEAAYAGLLPLILALGAPLLARRANAAGKSACPTDGASALCLPHAVPWLWALLPITAILALGDYTPLYHWLFDHIFLFRMTRVPARWLEVGSFAVALLAAFSFDGCRQQLALFESSNAPRSPLSLRLLTGSLWSVAALALIVGLAVLLVPSLASLWLPGARFLASQIPASAHITVVDIAANFRQTAILEAFMVCLLAGLLACLCGRWQQAGTRTQRHRMESLLIAVIAADVLLCFWRSTRLVPAADAAASYFWPPALTRLYQPGQRWTADVDWVAVNAGVPLGIDLFNGYDPMSGRRYFDFVDSFEGTGFWDGNYRPRHHPPLLNVAGVTHTLTEGAVMPQEATRPTLAARAGQWTLWQHDGAWPRVYLSRRVWRLPEARQLGTLNTLAAGSFAAQGQPVVIGPDSFRRVGVQPLSDRDRVAHWSRDWNEMQLATRANAASVLAQSEAWYPGWRAWVNGQEVPLERADFLFRGVEVPAGAAQVRVVYEPMSYRLGLFFSLCGLCGLGALIGFLTMAAHEKHGKRMRSSQFE